LVPDWLDELPLAPRTKGKIKALKHRLFEKATFWELIPVGRQSLLRNRSGRLFDLTAVECGVPVGLNANHRDKLGAVVNKKRLEAGTDSNIIAVNMDRTG